MFYSILYSAVHYPGLALKDQETDFLPVLPCQQGNIVMERYSTVADNFERIQGSPIIHFLYF